MLLPTPLDAYYAAIARDVVASLLQPVRDMLPPFRYAYAMRVLRYFSLFLRR